MALIAQVSIVPVQATYPSFISLRCSVVSGIGGPPIRIADLTPLIRSFPCYAQVGLDARDAGSLDGMPLQGDPQACQDDAAQCSSASASMEDHANAWARLGPHKGPMPWETGIFPSTHCSALVQSCRMPEVRWHRIAAVGNHLRPTPSGLAISLPHPIAKAALYVHNASNTALPLEKTGGDGPPRIYTPPAASGWTKAGSGTEPTSLRYPILTLGLPSTRQFKEQPAISGGRLTPVGRCGRLGHLGGSCFMLHGGFLDISPTGVPMALELIATAERRRGDPSLAALNGSMCIHADDATVTAASAVLDKEVVFWGVWSEPGEQYSPSPPRLQSPTTVSLQACSVPEILNVTRAVPDHAVVQHFERQIDNTTQQACDSGSRHATAPEAQVDRLLQGIPTQSWGAQTAMTAGAAMQLALSGYGTVLRQGLFGPRSGGFDTALVTSTGFARWPAVTLRMMQEIIRNRADHEVMLLYGGCEASFSEALHFSLCIDWSKVQGEIQNWPLWQLATQALLNRQPRLFDPGTMSWLPPSLLNFKEANGGFRDVYGSQVVVVNNVLLSIGGQVPLYDGTHFNTRDIFFCQLSSDHARTWERLDVTPMFRIAFDHPPWLPAGATVGDDFPAPTSDIASHDDFRRAASAAVVAPCLPSIPAAEVTRREDGRVAVTGPSMATTCIYSFGGALLQFPPYLASRNDTAILVLQSPSADAQSLTASLWTALGNEVADECTVGLAPAVVVSGALIYHFGGVVFAGEGSFEHAYPNMKSTACILDTSTGAWRRLAAIPTPLAFGSAWLFGNFILLGFGISETTTHAIYDFDTLTETWRVRSSSADSPVLIDGEMPFAAEVEDYDGEFRLLTSYRSTAMPALLSTDGFSAFPRMAPSCIPLGPRLYCWGGFLTELHFSVSEMVVAWTGIHDLHVVQPVDTAFIALMVSQNDSGTARLETERLDTLIGLQDARCIMDDSQPCGSLTQALTLASSPSGFANYRIGDLRPTITLRSSMVTPSLAVTLPVAIQGLPQASVHVICTTFDQPAPRVVPAFGTAAACIHVSPASASTGALYISNIIAIRGITASQQPMAFLQSLFMDVYLHQVTVSGFGLPHNAAEPSASSPEGAHVPLNGGCIAASQAELHIVTSTFRHCRGTTGGGVLIDAGVLRLRNSHIHDCHAQVKGGGLALASSIATLFNATVERNDVVLLEELSSSAHGGGIACFSSPSLEITASSVRRNTITSSANSSLLLGGGVSLEFCDAALQTVVLEQNEARGSGGGLYGLRSTLRGVEVALEANAAGGSGGAFYGEGMNSVTLSRCNVTGNRAVSGSGGGVLLDTVLQAASITHSSFVRNTAALDGGAMFFRQTAASAKPPRLSLQFTAFTDNEAVTGGGGNIYFLGAGLWASVNVEGVLPGNPKASYGSHVATEAVALAITNHAGTILPVQSGQGMDSTTAVRVALVDNFNNIVIDNTTLVELRGFDADTKDKGNGLNSNCTTEVALSGETLRRLDRGTAVFDDVTLRGLPGGCVALQAVTQRLRSSFVELDNLKTAEPYYVGFQRCEPGTALDSRDLQCQRCPSGRYSTSFNAPSCLVCPPGRAGQREGADACTVCSAGTYSHGGTGPQNDGCAECDEGLVAPHREAAACVGCPGGSFPLSQSQCSLCPPGRYATEGSSQCDTCSEGTYSGLGWNTCLSCPSNTRCEGGQLILQPGTWLNRATAVDAVALPRLNVSSEFHAQLAAACLDAATEECSTVAECVASQLQAAAANISNSASDSTSVAIPNERPNSADVFGIVAATQILPCPYPEACEVHCDLRLLRCRDGHEGMFCAVCKKGWELDGTTCRPCDYPPALSAAVTFLVVLATVVYVAVYVASNLTKKEDTIPLSKVVLKQLLNHLQLVSILQFTNVSSDSDTLFFVSSLADGLPLSLHPVLCVLQPTFYSQLALYLALPIAAVALSYAVGLAYHGITLLLRRRRIKSMARTIRTMQAQGQSIDFAKHSWQSTKEAIKVAIVVLCFLLYSKVAKTTMSTFHLYPHGVRTDPNDASLKYLLYQDFRLEAFTTSHAQAIALAIGSLVVYVFGLPLSGLLLLWRHKHKLQTPRVFHQYGFMYAGYDLTRRLWWWELVIIVRKLTMLSLVIFISSESSATLAALGVTTVFLSLQLGVKPYNQPLYNAIETVFVATQFTLQLLSALHQFTGGAVSPRTVTALIVVCFLGSIALPLYILLFLGTSTCFTAMPSCMKRRCRLPSVAATSRWQWLNPNRWHMAHRGGVNMSARYKGAAGSSRSLISPVIAAVNRSPKPGTPISPMDTKADPSYLDLRNASQSTAIESAGQAAGSSREALLRVRLRLAKVRSAVEDQHQ